MWKTLSHRCAEQHPLRPVEIIVIMNKVLSFFTVCYSFLLGLLTVFCNVKNSFFTVKTQPWDSIDPAIITKSFKKCSTSNTDALTTYKFHGAAVF